MEEDVDVPAGDPELRGHVLAGFFLEHPHRHDRALGVAEPVDARTEPDVLLGGDEERIPRRLVGRFRVLGAEDVEARVRPRAVVPAPEIPRGVPDDPAEERRPFGRLGRELSLLRKPQHRAERLLGAVDGVLGRGSLAPRDADEHGALGARETSDDVERFHAKREAPDGQVSSSPNLTPVRSRVARTFPRMTQHRSHAVLEVDESRFDAEVTRSTAPVLVDFATPWCQPCRVLEPVLESIAREHGDKVKVVRVDADANPDIATRFRVRGFPTVIAVVGGEERGRHVGVTNAATLLGMIARG